MSGTSSPTARTPRFNTVGVVGKRRDQAAAQVMYQVVAILAARGCRVLVEADVPAPPPASAASIERLAAEADLVVVVGGDGTLLGAARALADAGAEIPLVGVNQGRLGFLADVPPDTLPRDLDAILDGRFSSEPRLVLESFITRHGGDGTLEGPFHALNDVVIRNQASIRMVEFLSHLNGEFVSHHRADGMIVASPTGSTAYALSAGGPLVHPGLEALLMVPICPHTLSDRPLVVLATARVELAIEGDDRTLATVTWDGQAASQLRPGDSVVVHAAQRRLHLLHPPGHQFFGILRKKLRWGQDPVVG